MDISFSELKPGRYFLRVIELHDERGPILYYKRTKLGRIRRYVAEKQLQYYGEINLNHDERVIPMRHPR